MFTRRTWIPPTIPQGLDKDVEKYLRDLNKSILDYLRSLETPGGTVFDELKPWTPADASGASLSFTSPSGTYLVVGKMVIAWGRLTYPATASGANVLIGGLPLTVRNDVAIVGGGTIGYCTETTAQQIYCGNNATTFTLANDAGTTLVNSAMSGDTINFCLIYPY